MPASPARSEARRRGLSGASRAVWLGLGLLCLPLGALGAVSPLCAQETPCAACHDAEPAPGPFGESAHGVLECVDCHTGAEDFPHSADVAQVDCSTCHEEVVARYAESVHGQARARGTQEAPSCQACHGGIHAVVPAASPDSPVNPLRLPETCGACHSNPAMVAKFGIPVAKPLEAYRDSVHARLCAAGLEGASCSSCHGSHGIFAASDPRSTVFHGNVPETCGQCHADIAATYEESVHGQAAAHGVREAPVCTDCHGEHRILSPETRSSPVYASNIPKLTCGRCHGDLRLAAKYGIEEGTVPAYEDSYHGLASRAGKVTVANCSSCHGVHDILPSTNPASHVHPSNLARTCGACHPGAGKRYAIGKVHVLPTEREHAVVYWARLLYLWLIYGTIGGMLLHNGLDFYRKTRRPPPRPHPTGGGGGERMGRGFRAAHASLIVSFSLLVYSGFALKYPESWWATPLLHWEESIGLRGWLHRGAALLLLGALFFHLLHLVFDRHARSCIAAMRPRLHDVTELRERILWLVGRRQDPPPAPKLGYVEKAEYLALMWGIVVMSLTGFVLWFDNLALRLLPKWFSDLATVVHFYEAVLATLAIIVWHFYFVIFDPVVYPMDTAWLTGRESPGRAAERGAEEGEGDDRGRGRDGEPRRLGRLSDGDHPARV